MTVGATAAALGFLLAGAYAAAVLDAATAAVVAREPLAARVLGVPLRRAAVALLQRRSTTERPDAHAWALAPALLLGLAAVMLAPVPLAPGLVAAESPHGVLLFGAAAALVVVPVFLQGWSPNSLFALVGGYRMLAQALSYMIPLALALLAAVLPAESLSFSAIVGDQAQVWNAVRMPLGLPVYLAAAAGLAFWGPLALPSSPALAGGVELELSGGDVVAWRAGQLAVLVAASAAGAAVFLGGPAGPVLPGAVWMAAKTALLVGLLCTAAHTIPRLRPEQYVLAGWVVLLPLALVNIFVTGWWLL